MRSGSAGFVLQAKKTIRSLPGFTPAFARALPNGFTRWSLLDLCMALEYFENRFIDLFLEHIEISDKGLYSTLGGREAEREQQHRCCLSPMWRRLYHTGHCQNTK